MVDKLVLLLLFSLFASTVVSSPISSNKNSNHLLTSEQQETSATERKQFHDGVKLFWKMIIRKRYDIAYEVGKTLYKIDKLRNRHKFYAICLQHFERPLCDKNSFDPFNLWQKASLNELETQQAIKFLEAIFEVHRHDHHP